MRTGRNIGLTSSLQCAAERRASYFWTCPHYESAIVSLSDDQDPYIPQPPAQVLEKLPPQPLSSEQRTVNLARVAGGFLWSQLASPCSLQHLVTSGARMRTRGQIWTDLVSWHKWKGSVPAECGDDSCCRELVLFDPFPSWTGRIPLAEEQQVERKKGVADMLSFEPLGTKLDVEVCPKMSFCCLFIDGKRQMKLVFKPAPGFFWKDLHSSQGWRSGRFGHGRKKKAKVKQPKWREYFYGNMPVQWNQALQILCCKEELRSFYKLLMEVSWNPGTQIIHFRSF